jgi:hypothetical protein
LPTSLTADFVRKAIASSFWDFGNHVLYDLCARHPAHDHDDVIVAKVWLIGRSYAAAIERKRDTVIASDGDSFYEQTVAPKIRKSGIDTWFRALSADKSDDLALTLKVHKKVMDLFTEISRLKQRSLASKYLHFHFPKRYYIYDSRAHKGIRALTNGIRRHMPPLKDYDDTYARFFLRAHALHSELSTLTCKCLTPREVDKVLLAWNREPQRK